MIRRGYNGDDAYLPSHPLAMHLESRAWKRVRFDRGDFGKKKKNVELSICPLLSPPFPARAISLFSKYRYLARRTRPAR